jgi:uncharacterized protein (TIGR02145 family)
MEKAKTIFTVTGVFVLMFSYWIMSVGLDNSTGSGNYQTDSKSTQTKTPSPQTKPTTSKPAQTKTTTTKSAPSKTTTTTTGTKSTQTKSTPAKSAQTKTKSTQTKSKTAQKSTKPEPVKSKDAGTVRIGKQAWAVANLNVSTFRNGDSIPEARTNKDWVTAGESGKPAWCYYNNDPRNGLKYGKLYNWYAVNDPRGLAPAGWSLPGDTDWLELIRYLGGMAGNKMKSINGWSEGNSGTNESGFLGLPGGYRVENGTFLNSGSIATWWCTTESKVLMAFDYYLTNRASLDRSSSPKRQGESVRCIRK